MASPELPSRSPWKRYLIPLSVIALAALLLGYFFIPLYRDHTFLHLPIALSQPQIQEGFLPTLFHPGLDGGEPLSADPNTLVLYPVMLLHYLMDPAWLYAATFFSHLFLSGFFLYLIAVRTREREWALLAAVAWVTCGPFLSASVSMNLFLTVAWIPGIYLAAVPRIHRGWAALAMALLIFSGEWVLALATLVTCFGLTREKIRYLKSLLLAFLMALPPIVAAFSTFRFTARGMGLYPVDAALAASLHPVRLIGLLLPFFFGNHADFTHAWRGAAFTRAPDFLLPTLQISWILLLLYFLGRKKWKTTLWMGLWFLLALGIYNPVVHGLAGIIPGFTFLRFPVKLMILVVFLLILQVNRITLGMKSLLFAGSLFTLVTLAAHCFLVQGVGVTLPVVAAIGAQWLLLMMMVLPERVRAPALAIGLILNALVFLLPVLGLDLQSASVRKAISLPQGLERADRVYDATSFPKEGFDTFTSYARAAWRAGLAPTALRLGVNYAFAPDVAGSWSVLDRMVEEKMGHCTWKERRNILRAYGVNKVITDTPLDAAGFHFTARDGHWFIYDVEDPLPAALLVGKAVTRSTPKKAVDFLANGGIDPREELLLPGGGESRGEAGSVGEVLAVQMGADCLDLQVRLDRPGYLLIRRTYFPVIDYFDNGHLVKAQPANVSLTSLKLNAGDHRIRGEVPKRTYHLAALVSLFTLIVTLLGIFRRRTKRVSPPLSYVFL